MGHQISANQQFRCYVRQSLQERYHTNLFLKNRKSSHQFKKELNSVCKRSSYLNYDWAKLLHAELRTSDPNQLYSEYETTLKENCVREGKREKIFCPAKIQREFITHFSRHFKEETQLSVERLDEAFEQTKSYFMVMSWLHKMVTLRAQDQENKQTYVNQEWDLSEEDEIYEILLRLAQKTFDKIKGIAANGQSTYRFEHLSPSLARLIKKLMAQKLKFFEREAIVSKIQEELRADSSNLESNVEVLKKVLGEDVIYGYLRTIREVGHVDVDDLWSLFGEELS